MKIRKIPATMPPATSMKTPVGQDPASQLLAGQCTGPLENPTSISTGVEGNGETYLPCSQR